MRDSELEYVFPDYCHIEKVSGKELETILEKEGVSNKCILFDEKNKSMFFINESIFNFLELFKSPRVEKDILKELKVVKNEEVKLVNDFIKSMLKRGFLVLKSQESKIKNKSKRAFKDFETIDLLKESEYESVCLARNKSGTEVVLKYLNFDKETPKKTIDKRRGYFRQEFEVMEKVSKLPSICNLLSFNPKGDYAVLEYIKGQTLKDAIHEGELDIEQKVTIANQLIETIAYLHQNKIIHGDIHAKQFILTKDYKIKLIDFGLSLNLNLPIEGQSVRRGGIHNYLEPENINSNAFSNLNTYVPNFRAEVYRLGALLYFLVYEKYPFESFSWIKLCNQIKNESVKLNPITPRGEKVPKSILSIMEKSLLKDPMKRFDTVKEMKIN